VQVLSEFHDASGGFTRNLQDTSRRQLGAVGVRESDIEQVIASGKVGAVLQEAVVGSDQIHEIVDEIEQRHAAIAKLERSVKVNSAPVHQSITPLHVHVLTTTRSPPCSPPLCCCP
jgi:hypothetical protein